MRRETFLVFGFRFIFSLDVMACVMFLMCVVVCVVLLKGGGRGLFQKKAEEFTQISSKIRRNT